MHRLYTILYLEDDWNEVVLFQHAVKQSRFPCQVYYVPSIVQARQYLLADPPYADRSTFLGPDLILTDVIISSESGLDFIAWLRTKPPLNNIPVVCLTGSDDPHALARIEALNIPVARKTSPFQEALAVIRKSLERARLLRLTT